MAFLREVFRDWGRTIFPQMFMDINLITDTLAKSFWTEPSSVYNDTELQAFVISLDKVMKVCYKTFIFLMARCKLALESLVITLK